MKTWIITPAFCSARMLEDCLRHIYSHRPIAPVEHVVLDNHYPTETDGTIRQVAEKYGCTYFDSGGDFGLSRSVTQAVREIGVNREDVVCGCDPDDRPSPGWVDTLRKVMLADRSFAVLGGVFPFCTGPLQQQHLAENQTPFEVFVKGLVEEEVAGVRVLVHPSVEMIKVAALSARMLVDFGYPTNYRHPYYGGQESMMFEWWKTRKMRLGYVPSVTVRQADASLFDMRYRRWKDAHLGGWPGSYKDWINDGRR
jgi:hypothetical protein